MLDLDPGQVRVFSTSQSMAKTKQSNHGQRWLLGHQCGLTEHLLSCVHLGSIPTFPEPSETALNPLSLPTEFNPISSCYKLTQLRSLWIFLGPVDPFSPHLASNSLPWTHTSNVAPGSLCQEQPISLE